MKRKIALATTLISMFLTTNVFAAISLTIDGKPLPLDTPPVVVEGRTLVPVRAILENLGATVAWDEKTGTVTATTQTTTIKLVQNSTIATVNGVQKTLDVPAQSINGRILVPARFVAENLNCTVNWNPTAEKIEIITNAGTTANGTTTTEQTIKPKKDEIIPAPPIIYTTPASENGLAETIMYDVGKIIEIKEMKGYPCIVLETSQGKITIINVTGNENDWGSLKVGNYSGICFVYLGYSEVTKTPSGAYLLNMDLTDMYNASNDFASRYAKAIKLGEYVTYTKYSQIKEGMSYIEVVEIIKAPGSLFVESDGYTIYTWTAKDAIGVASVAFLDGKVVAKSQVGL